MCRANQTNSLEFIVKLLQNSFVSYFEECLTLGNWLSQEEKRALYKYLTITKKNIYRADALQLIKSKLLQKEIANGKIYYQLKDNEVSYKADSLLGDSLTLTLRNRRLGHLESSRIRKLVKFFAQAEVDVMSNFPLPGPNEQELSSFNMSSYPFYDLNYYSNGKGKILGFIKKLKTNDSEVLAKLAS